jgi:hypothetical protein
MFFKEDVAMKETKRNNPLELDELFHPARAFAHPSDVVADPDLTLNEKRSILASWASDACALEACPDMRDVPGAGRVKFDDIMDALRTLDRESNRWLPKYRRIQREHRLRRQVRRNDPGHGQPLQ